MAYPSIYLKNFQTSSSPLSIVPNFWMRVEKGGVQNMS